ncbi:MAG: peptidase U32 family protein [Treponemataceae bacterium]
MELVAPGGNLEKLHYAYEYGADAVYIGLKSFSLRIKADNFYDNEHEIIIQLKKKYPKKKLFCALNITFHNDDIDHFLREIEYFKQYPFDAFIVQDIGIVPIIQKHFPHCALHLSTQANCVNREAVKVYQNMGFKRVVVGRETTLKEIAQIKEAVPSMEIEAFAHGAMCIAYSGRCLLSANTTARSANAGFCSHSCRWDYKVLEEKERPGEYFPIFEGDKFTAILSSKDLCMIDHLQDMKNAGVDSLKIEGRMKSLYYVSIITRAYRKASDVIEGKITQQEAKPFIDEIYKTTHREFATGFYFNRSDANKTTTSATNGEYDLVGTIGKKIENMDSYFENALNLEKIEIEKFEAMHPQKKAAHLKEQETKGKIQFLKQKKGFSLFEYNAMNKLSQNQTIEYVSPDVLCLEDSDYQFIDPETYTIRTWISHGHSCFIYTDKPISEDFIVRAKM